MSRLILPSCVLVASVLVGLPDLTALERAVSKVFVSDAPPMQPSLAVGAPTPPPGAADVDGLEAGPAVLFTAPALLPQPAVDAPISRIAVAASASRSTRIEGMLTPLYASFVALQALDIHSTLVAIERGARETNPAMAPFVDQPAAFVALKAGTAAGILYMTERVRRHSPLGAVLMMVAFNSAYATVVSNNYRIASRAR